MASDGKRAGGEPPSGLERRVAVAAVMALTVVAGVGVVLLFPRPRALQPVELSRPAPVTQAHLPTWLAPPPQAPPAGAVPVPAGAPKPAAPPLRSRRLAEAQAAKPHPVRSRVIQVVSPRPSPCRTPQSLADRLVCGRPALASQDQAMRRAYDRALAAGADRLSIDRAQATWRGQRDRATSEDELSRLYARRIVELTEAARRSERRRIYG